LDEDIAEIDNLAADHPEKLESLKELWWQEAERYGVLPLDDMSHRPSGGWWPEPKDRWVLYQDAVLPHHFKSGPRVRGVSHRIVARIERGSTDNDGTIIADGGRFGGWSIFIHGNRLHYTTNNFGERCRTTSSAAIPAGVTTLRIDVVRTGEDEGRVRFYIDDKTAGEGVLSPFGYHNFVNEPLEVGLDSQTPVDDLYASPFEFQGKIADVVIEAFGTEVLDHEALLEELMTSQ
jgi:arylsulfatase